MPERLPQGPHRGHYLPKTVCVHAPSKYFENFPAANALLYEHLFHDVRYLIPLAIWVSISSLDDLALDLACLYLWFTARFLGKRRVPIPTSEDLEHIPRRRIAIFVPLWHEHAVIRRMVEHNLSSIRYDTYDFFIGAYPNDEATLQAVRDVETRFHSVHLAIVPHNGPTSKADCLNSVYQRMLLYEETNGVSFDMVLIHDAEDMIHPEALPWLNFYAQFYDMVQIPVLPLPTPVTEFTHGIYCDEFAEFQRKDLPARQILGGFVPSCGVGTGFSRGALAKLAAAYDGRIFEPKCLTEDYEIGFRLHKLGCSQVFVPARKYNGNLVATREYFPRAFRGAVKQRTRWMTGIALQSWEMHGWRETFGQIYWFWRDRKPLIGHLLTPAANYLFGREVVLCAMGISPCLTGITLGAMILQAVHLTVKIGCSASVYGWRYALAAPLRLPVASAINFLATTSAIRRYATARWRRRGLVWLKTDHAYPGRDSMLEKRKLGEILVRSRRLTESRLNIAVATQPPGLRLGEYLVRLGHISEDELYEALNLQQNLPIAAVGLAAISRHVARTIPAGVARKWKVIPLRVDEGRLLVAGPDLPCGEMKEELRRHCSLEIRFQLITPADFSTLKREFLPGS
jgi:adsorption protein B